METNINNYKLCFIIAQKYYRNYTTYIKYFVDNIQEFYPGSLCIIIDNNSIHINDIIDKSMTKLYKHLKQFYDEMKEDNEYKICSVYLDNEKTIIDNKYDEYQNNENTQKIVQNHLIDLYDKNKEKTLNNYKTILECDSSEIDKIIGF